jgi:hypothetical protein
MPTYQAECPACQEKSSDIDIEEHNLSDIEVEDYIAENEIKMDECSFCQTEYSRDDEGNIVD